MCKNGKSFQDTRSKGSVCLSGLLDLPKMENTAAADMVMCGIAGSKLCGVEK